MSRHIETFEASWNGIQLAITYEPRWLNLSDDYGLDTAHLQIEATLPERAALPITETGYKSHFTTASVVTAMGGPVACVMTWLDQEAASPTWQRQAQDMRQLALF